MTQFKQPLSARIVPPVLFLVLFGMGYSELKRNSGGPEIQKKEKKYFENEKLD